MTARLPLLLFSILLTVSGVVHAKPPQPATVGSAAPGFTLNGVDGKPHSLADFRGRTVVLEWFNPDCPFVQLAHGRTQTLKDEGTRQKKAGVEWVAINSSAAGKQGHGKATNQKGIQRFGIQYPVLMDPTGRVGRLYKATRTPEIFIIDAAGTLVYRGAIDNSQGGDIEKDKPFVNYVRNTLSQLAANKAVQPAMTKPWGCSVKY